MDAQRQGDENPILSVDAKTITLLAKNFNVFQNIDRSQKTVTKYLTDRKPHAAINSKHFRKLDHVNNALNEFEPAKAQTEDKELVFVGFFVLQYAKLAKLRFLELYYNFFNQIL